MAEATKNVLKDAGAVISDTAHEAVSAAVDTAHIALTAVKNKRSEFEDAMDEDEEEDSELFEDEGFLDDDYVDDDDLFDYSRTESDGIPAWKKPLPEETPAPAAPAAEPAPAEEPAEPDQTTGAEKVTIEEDTIWFSPTYGILCKRHAGSSRYLSFTREETGRFRLPPAKCGADR